MKYNFDELVNRENTNCVKWNVIGKKFGDEKAPVWVADMDFPCPENVVKALNERTEHPIFGYTIDPETTQEHITSWFARRYNYVVPVEACVLTTGVLQSLSAALRLFAKAGDEVLIPAPTYKPFRSKTELNDMVPVFTPMVWRNDRYELDFEDMEAKITDKTKVFILCNPQNPSGRMFDKQEIEQIAAFCEKHNLKIISDEIHIDFQFDGHKITPILNTNEYTKNNCISLVSIGKTFNMAGIKGSAAFVLNEEMRKAFVHEAEKSGISDLNMFAMTALNECFTEESEEWLDQVLAYISENRNYVEKFLQENLPECVTYKPEGTYFYWLDLRNCGVDKNLVHEKLQEAGAYCNPGNFFGEDYVGFERMNLACPRVYLEYAMKHLMEVFKK